MIQGYACRKTRLFVEEGFCDKLFRSFKKQAEKRLRILEAATSLHDLMQLRSNRFEALGGDRKGQYSIRINKQWRICFTWNEGEPGPDNVAIVDYH